MISVVYPVAHSLEAVMICRYELIYLYVFLLSRFLIEAPFSALAGVVADARDPPKVSFLERAHNNL